MLTCVEGCGAGRQASLKRFLVALHSLGDCYWFAPGLAAGHVLLQFSSVFRAILYIITRTKTCRVPPYFISGADGADGDGTTGEVAAPSLPNPRTSALTALNIPCRPASDSVKPQLKTNIQWTLLHKMRLRVMPQNIVRVVHHPHQSVLQHREREQDHIQRERQRETVRQLKPQSQQR
jgi:hypothetical protein